MSDAILYVVSTPIGNLSDLSPRGASTLADVTVVYAEDTRRTRRLLRRLDIGTRVRSLHAHNERSRLEELLGRLAGGESCAIVSDAGTPGISDPGRRAVEAALDAGYRVVPVPGPSAILAALVASGLPSARFAFLGFPPRGGGRRRAWMEEARRLPMTVVAFEAPGRIGALLEDLVAAGLGYRSCAVCREMTKLYEEVRRGTVSEQAGYYSGRDVRGEITLVIEGNAGSPGSESGDANEEAERVAAELTGKGLSVREVARRLRAETGLARNEAYRIALRAGGEGD
ncbi:MAG: 16S rRNA (cytidine(1402)-2'-O)-methyltransferase [Gemmatimonadota bacterium]